MKSEDKKAAIADYRKRKNAAGIFAVRCAASNQVWVGQTLNLDTVQNRIWFTLRVGTHSTRDLQSAWTSHGADSFTFEPLEDEEIPYIRDTLLKERITHWRMELNGLVI
jgi:hypothetical protein